MWLLRGWGICLKVPLQTCPVKKFRSCQWGDWEMLSLFSIIYFCILLNLFHSTYCILLYIFNYIYSNQYIEFFALLSMTQHIYLDFLLQIYNNNKNYNEMLFYCTNKITGHKTNWMSAKCIPRHILTQQFAQLLKMKTCKHKHRILKKLSQS